MTAKRSIQITLILMATLFGYQLPSLNLSFPIAMLGVISYAIASLLILKFSDRQSFK